MDFPKSIESETDRRKVHELASRSMGVRRRVRERIKNMHVVKMLICQCRVFTHFKFQGRELLFKKKNASRQSVWASMSVITSRNFHKLAENM